MNNNYAKPLFFKLGQDKQRLIIKAAVQQFASHGYQKASSNAIVKEAGISKGALFQYFANKEALFLFVFAEFTGKVKQKIRNDINWDSDFFSLIQGILLAGLAFVDKYPAYYQIYLRVVFELDVPRRDELLTKVRLFSQEYFSDIVRLSQGNDILRADLSVEMIIYIVDSAIDHFLQEYGQGHLARRLGFKELREKQLLTAVDQIVLVLQDGLKK